MILVPKLKYEHLLKNLASNEESMKPDTMNNKDEGQQLPERTQDDTTTSDSNHDTSQIGSGYVSRRKTIGKPPGVTMKQRKKHVPWLTY